MLRGVAPRTHDLTQPDLVAKAVRRRRLRLGLGQDDVPGVGRSVIGLLETAKQTRYQARSLAAVGAGLDWPDDWVERVESGENLTNYPDDATIEPDLAARLDLFDAKLDEVREGVEANQRSMVKLLRTLQRLSAAQGVDVDDVPPAAGAE